MIVIGENRLEIDDAFIQECHPLLKQIKKYGFALTLKVKKVKNIKFLNIM